MPLEFDTARVSVPAAPQRTDITCFVGYVRTRNAPLPRQVTDDLRAAGWIDGPWRRSETQIRTLEQLPVVVESWDAFDQIFDWRSRPVAAASAATCASYLGAAVRRFFAQGGRRAIVVRVGDPWRFMDAAGTRDANRTARIAPLVPQFVVPSLPFDPTDPRTWRGIQHLYGLPEASLVCMPDLADACGGDPAPPDATLPLVPISEGFVECSHSETVPSDDLALRYLHAPRSDHDGLEAWTRAVGATRDFLYLHRKDVLLIGALPLMATASAQRDPLAYLREEHVLLADGVDPGQASSAFVQIGYPWLSTRAAADLPQLLEPPDGLLTGLIAAGALARGTFRSVAGTLLPAVLDTEPVASWSLGADHPWAALAERICLVAHQPDGWALQSDVTTSPHATWRAGGVSRMLASLVRAARATGETELFGANGPALWTRVRRHLESLLTAYWQEGGLGGSSLDEAFEVSCDRSTMTQADLDAGRLIAKISVLPAAAIERITVVLALSAAGQIVGEVREVA
jgi:Bacteriophage tail sheath protein